MQFYRDDQGTFHRTQADAKASGRQWKPMEVPTDHKGLCEFLNLLNPPIEYLPQIRDMLSRPPGEPVEKIEIDPRVLTIDYADVEHRILGKSAELIVPDEHGLPGYQEGQPTTVFMKSRDPQAIFTCTNCGKVNKNIARS